MHSYVDTRCLDATPLQFKASAPGAFSACVGQLVAGGISLKLSPRGDGWCWSVTGPIMPRILQPCSGEAETLARAQAEFREKFEAWLRWTQGYPALWNA